MAFRSMALRTVDRRLEHFNWYYRATHLLHSRCSSKYNSVCRSLMPAESCDLECSHESRRNFYCGAPEPNKTKAEYPAPSIPKMQHRDIPLRTSIHDTNTPIPKMASQKLYPRPTLRRIMRAHTKMNVGKNVDILVRAPLPPRCCRQQRGSRDTWGGLRLTKPTDIPRLHSLPARVRLSSTVT